MTLALVIDQACLSDGSERAARVVTMKAMLCVNCVRVFTVSSEHTHTHKHILAHNFIHTPVTSCLLNIAHNLLHTPVTLVICSG